MLWLELQINSKIVLSGMLDYPFDLTKLNRPATIRTFSGAAVHG